MTGVFRKRLIFMALACVFGAMSLGVADREAAAQSGGRAFNSVQNWLPHDFQIACGTKDGPFRPVPRNTVCIAGMALNGYEASAWSAAQAYKAAGFVSPYNFGPIIDRYGGGDRSIRIFTDVTGRSVLAHVAPKESPFGKWCDREGYRFMAVNPPLLGRYPSYAVGLVASHELFHAVQMAIPGQLMPNEHRKGKCFPPKWVMESQADAAAIDFTRREFPSSFPPTPGQRFATNMAGLRPYYIPLNYKHGLTAYDTNSFWLYIGDYFHNRKFKYLEDYAKAPARMYGDQKEDWLRWLDDNLRTDPKIKTPLYLFYPGFLTHFAGEWAAGGVGRKFGRETWLTKAFGGCQSVNLSPQTPYEEISVNLHKMAGKCLSVTITGLEATDLATVKVGALAQRQDIADSLHLGFAFTNDQTGFNCAQTARRDRPPAGVAGCLLEPVTGDLDTGSGSVNAARMWYASSIEKGSGSTQSNTSAGGAIENVYILSYVPVKPWEEKLEGKPPITVRIGIGVEWSTLSVNVSNVGNNGLAGTARNRAVAAKGRNALESDMTVPPSTGWIDDSGLSAIMGSNLLGVLGEARREAGKLALEMDPDGKSQSFQVFSLATALITPQGGGPSEESIEVSREFHVGVEKPLPAGATGSFPASISGGDRDGGVQYFTEKKGDVTLTIFENSPEAFRASVEGTVCEVNMEAVAAVAAAGGHPIACSRRFPVSGSISKPFNYLYDPTVQFVAVETEGEKLYN
ncbi:MAG: hypothetical protein ACTSU0_00265, partial [Alphaproteobacteria bacterium]